MFDLTGRVVVVSGASSGLGAQMIDWFAAQGAEVSTQIHEGGHELRPAEISALQTLLTAM